MFDQFVHVASARPPDSTGHSGTYRVTAVTVTHTHRWTTLVRILDENHVHLHVPTITTSPQSNSSSEKGN